jgi:RNA-directed DNA polymerase
MMHGHGKSDPNIVAVRPANRADAPAAEQSVAGADATEPVERRTGAKENAEQQSTCRAQSRESVSPALDRIRQVARTRKEEKFTALLHHINPDLLKEAFFELKQSASPGVDGVTWDAYEADLDGNMEDLHARVHRGAYRALPSRRVYIPKPDGRQRPLAVAALEDKIVQRATAVVLNAIYEEDFLGFSYGFRSGRSAHDAMDALIVGIERKRVNFILDADIRSFFDTVSHEWLRKFVEHRIADRRVIHLIMKWLKVGVLENGIVTAGERGTGQGAVISPLLANIYLHYVLDLWAERWRRHEATGDMIFVRYADDFIAGFQHEHDARRFLDTLRARLAEFALSLHPEKTRLIEFGRYAALNRKRRGLGKPETFNFLGFTFICGKSRKGSFLIKRKTRRDRMHAKLVAVSAELRRRMHWPVPELGKWLGQVVKGYFNYHAVPTNSHALQEFYDEIVQRWRRALPRRSQKEHLSWGTVLKLAQDWLPHPHILHPWPNQRFAVRYPRWEPYAGKPHVRICAGGAR